MTDEFYGLSVIKLSILLVTVLHGSSITSIDTGIGIANVTGYNVAVPSQVSSSPIAESRSGQSEEKVQESFRNHDTSAVVNLVEAPVEVIGPRVVESAGTPEKVERKRESRTGPVINLRALKFKSKNHGCVLIGDGSGPEESVEDSYKTNDDKRESDSTKQDVIRSRLSVEGEDEEYDNHKSRSSEMIEDEDEDDDDDDDDDEAGDVVVDYDKKRRNLRRKAGRNYRQGPKIWDQWGKWTSCSVSCGAGKLTRWRHCVAGGCSLGEKEAQLKTCTFSAC